MKRNLHSRIAIPPPLLVAVLLLFGTAFCHAAKISELAPSDFAGQALRFLTLRDPALRQAMLGSVLLGVSCGLLGSFIVVRRMALMGDALAHAVLPGVVLGFLWTMSKNPVAIFIGATVFGLLGAAAVNAIKQTTKVKEDAALGLVLAGFYAAGICLLTMMQQLPFGGKSGIDKFLFGQAAAISSGDVKLMAVITGFTVLVVFLFYKEFLVTSFDPGFARASGFPTHAIHYALMLLLAFTVVISLQAVGVVLVTAMLITPAAAAYLLTDRMGLMLVLAAAIGVASGVSGAFFSFLGNNLPTGPFMVLASSALFAVSFLFAPRHGTIPRWLRHRSRAARTRRENTLKSIYRVLEDRSFDGESVSMRELAEQRREAIEEAHARAMELRNHGLATLHEDGAVLSLTPSGWQRACAIVRNHRLWELYLTKAADFAADHVHEDAEKIEHVLGDEIVRELERRLSFARLDPHGRKIPSLADIYHGAGAPARIGADAGGKQA